MFPDLIMLALLLLLGGRLPRPANLSWRPGAYDRLLATILFWRYGSEEE